MAVQVVLEGWQQAALVSAWNELLALTGWPQACTWRAVWLGASPSLPLDSHPTSRLPLQAYRPGHRLPVSAVRWNNLHSCTFLSGAADWQVKMWDSRMPKVGAVVFERACVRACVKAGHAAAGRCTSLPTTSLTLATARCSPTLRCHLLVPAPLHQRCPTSLPLPAPFLNPPPPPNSRR